jgi:hypothetical protein
MLAAAVELWRRAGAAPRALAQVRLVIQDMPGQTDLAQAVGATIRLDVDAAGWGWSTAVDGVASGRIDLLSVLVHELGHMLGLDHGDAGMAEVLLPGERSLAVPAVARHDGPVLPLVLAPPPDTPTAREGAQRSAPQPAPEAARPLTPALSRSALPDPAAAPLALVVVALLLAAGAARRRHGVALPA